MSNFSDAFNGNVLRLCADCAVNEQRLDQNKISQLGWKISHGICLRHFRKMFETAGFPRAEVDKIVKDKFGKGGQAPVRDLSETENKPLLHWLKNPTAPKTA